MSRIILAVALLSFGCSAKKSPTPDAEPMSTTGDETVADDTDSDTREELDTPENTVDESLEIAATRWNLVWIRDTELPAGHGDPTLFFLVEPGTPPNLSGYAGCNAYFGTGVAATSDTVNFGMMGSTMRACDNLGLEQTFMHMMHDGDQTWSVSGDVLTLSKDGEERLRFERGQAASDDHEDLNDDVIDDVFIE